VRSDPDYCFLFRYSTDFVLLHRITLSFC
jgi:hypothetical protein